MNTISSLLEWIGNTIGDNPNSLKTTDKTIVGGINSVWEIVYPVGSYYETSDASFNPNTAFGGTWVMDSQGRVTVGAGTESGHTYTAGDTGGSKDAIVPTHTHPISAFNIGGGAHTSHTMRGYGDTLGGGSLGWRFGSGGSKTATGIIEGGAHTHTVGAHNTNAPANGVAVTDKNMQPYTVVCRWHRTA